MKALLTYFLFAIFTTTALANNGTEEVKMKRMEASVVLVNNTEFESSQLKSVKENKQEVARLYKFKNSRVQKALAFELKKYNKSRLA
ncbi:hypothetical protein [Euzebyella saccharophila]|uniref:Uncharacterized protein n=1 Tax=Euzebyella saccharophila TaxID=679664 RepID=A0ABV8JHS0_9FLAO|nr:hypothetical protein [Euzebyella saccharophila]